jgi:A/G-specific adenine glycosylase
MFAHRLIQWQQQHGRHHLPWQGADAYRVWLSEIMLQQTQVTTVIPYFHNFLAHFPNLAALAAAHQDAVLAQWSGLGYYSRARNLHRAAQLIVAQHGGQFPSHFDDILALPGIGRSTAAAISVFVFGQQRAILDGNVKRVLARHGGIVGATSTPKIEAQLWQEAEARLPQRDLTAYTQGLMDLGAMICTRSRPKCGECPVRSDCIAEQTGRVAELPTPRVRAVKPERHSTFLLLLHDGEIWLEKRANIGLWGGLWCAPQWDAADDALRDCAQKFTFSAQQIEPLPTFSHTFTHFKLHITPLLLRVASKPLHVGQNSGAWMHPQDALKAGIPTPMRKILLAL